MSAVRVGELTLSTHWRPSLAQMNSPKPDVMWVDQPHKHRSAILSQRYRQPSNRSGLTCLLERQRRWATQLRQHVGRHRSHSEWHLLGELPTFAIPRLHPQPLLRLHRTVRVVEDKTR
jgi:hypothetical protein